jgi:large subunit ribosomal protein L9
MAVELILKKPVLGLGLEADVVRVKPGYARNYLLPRDLATVATQASKKMVEDLKKSRAAREAAELNAAEEMATALKKLTITFQMEHGNSEKVFGSVTSQDIAARLEIQGHKVDRKKIDLPKPLKALGEHEVPISLPMGVQAKIKVVLEAPQSAAAAEEASVKGKKTRPAKKTKE